MQIQASSTRAEWFSRRAEGFSMRAEEFSMRAEEFSRRAEVSSMRAEELSATILLLISDVELFNSPPKRQKSAILHQNRRVKV